MRLVFSSDEIQILTPLATRADSDGELHISSALRLEDAPKARPGEDLSRFVRELDNLKWRNSGVPQSVYCAVSLDSAALMLT